MTPGEFVTAGHLGGYVAGGDPETTYPALFARLLRDVAPVDPDTGEQGRPRVLDVGCGDGATVRRMSARGADVIGVDGVPQDDPFIITHDYTTGPSPIVGDFDLVWSCEFVEHVDARYVENFLPDLARGRFLAMTHALPGQPGWHHVNCQPPTYWINLLAEHRMVVDYAKTMEYRRIARRGFFNATGLFFERAYP